MKIKKSRLKISRFSATIIIILLLVVGYSTAYISSITSTEITIKDKERITTGRGENINSKFIVYTENEVFENTDNWLFLKFRSTDFQNHFDLGETYKVKVVGWRIPFLSHYRNIVKIENSIK